MSAPELPRSLGRYQIVRELGKGAMGVVYEGVDPVIGRRVAIKTMRRDVVESSGMGDELMERFLREARAAGGISHPNVITIYDAGEEDGIAYMAMEFVESGTLFERLYSGNRMTPEEAVGIGAAVCNALAAAHDKGIVHRDVKPANIMMLAEGTVKVADFGIARVSDSTLTQEGVMVGTPQYMSPEQFSGLKLDGRSDLFSAAVIIYEMLTGEHPFPAQGVGAIMHQVLKVEPVPPRELNFEVNDNLSAVVMKALQKPPRRRYQDGRKLAAAIVEALKDNPDPAVLGLTGPAENADAATVIPGADAATVLSSVRPDGSLAESARVPRRRKFLRPSMIVPAAAGLLMIGGLALLLAGPVKKPDPAVTDGFAFSKASITVWLPISKEHYADAIKEPSAKNCRQLGEANIVIKDSETNDVLLETISDTASGSLKKKARNVIVTVSQTGFKDYSKPYEAHAADDTVKGEFILEPE